MLLLSYIVRRTVFALVVMLGVSIVAFTVIQLPPGDYLTTYIQDLQRGGEVVDEQLLDALRYSYGLDQPLHMQYLKWMWKMLQGNFGMSFDLKRPVLSILLERLPLTLALSVSTLILIYAIAMPIGIYAAVHQYSIGDYVATVIGFVGVATPNFILALVLMWAAYKYFGISVGGLISQPYLEEPWHWPKILDLLKHLPAPIIVIGISGTAGIIRVMRGGLLDELSKQYVITARAKGLSEGRVIRKYPLRIALNPIISSVAWVLPELVSGQTIVAVVLGLPTIGPLLYRALIFQDMYLAGSTVMVLSLFTVIGVLISDILLGLLDPRIRYE